MVLEDGDGDGRVEADCGRGAEQAVQQVGDEQAEQRVYADEGSGVRKPLYLLTLLEAGATIAERERERRENNGAVQHQLPPKKEDADRLFESIFQAHRVREPPGWFGYERSEDNEHSPYRDDAPSQRPPVPRW